LECISGQTYTNLEIIVSDNASPGSETELVVGEFMATDDRIRYFRQSENMGPMFNFVFVLQKATGEYFAWAADDDEWKNSYVENCLERFRQNDKLALCYSEAVIRNYRGQQEYLWPSDMVTESMRREDGIRKILLNQHRNTEFYGLMKTADARKYRMRGFFGEDHVFVLHLALSGEIDRTDPGLFISGVGRTGSSNEAIVRALRLGNSQKYFGYVYQMAFMLRLILLENYGLRPATKARILLSILHRFFSPQSRYSQAIHHGIRWFFRDLVQRKL